MQIQIINPIEYSGWDDFLLTVNNYSFFHSAAWARVLSESYNYTPLYFLLKDNDRMLSIFPLMEVNSFLTGKRGVSLPFTDYCKPILTDEGRFHEILSPVKKYGKNAGWKYIEFRGGDDLFTIPSFSSYFIHQLDLLPDVDSIKSKFRDSTKRNIRKATKEGVSVQFHNSLESVKAFYRLNCMTRKDHGLPPQPYSFFENVYKYIISPKKGFVILASHGNSKNIAGSIFFHFGNKVVFKYGASDKKYLSCRANNLIMWEAISRYAKKGFKSLSFGRTEVENKGLLQYKRGWGCTEVSINYYKYNIKKAHFIRRHIARNSILTAILRKMPSPILKKAGSLLYRHIG